MYNYGRGSRAVLDQVHPTYRPPLMDVIKIQAIRWFDIFSIA